MRMFNTRKKDHSINLIDFSIMDISTGQIGSYIINFLYKELNFKHIGYRIYNIDGNIRCELYTLSNNKDAIWYFKDRCSGMIEDKVKTMKPIPHNINRLEDGFEEVVDVNN